MAEQRQNNVELTDEEKEQRAKKRNRTIITVVSVAAAVLIVVIVLLLLLVKCEPEENVDPPVGHTHTYSSWVVVDEPTCTEEGLRERTCSCGEKETEEIAALGHTAGEAVKENEKAPTCTVAGSYEEVVSCTVCNEEVSRKTVTVDALGHTAGEAVKENEVAATCLTAGSYEEVVCCAVCGEEMSRKTVEVAALGHDYKGEVTDEALCLVPGEMTYTCTRCDDSYTEEIAPLRHSWGETKPGQAPTCTAAGYTSYETCTRCGYSNRETIPAAGHTWGEWQVTTPATCTEAGVEERTCSRCQETEKETIAALDHEWGDPTWSWEDDYTSATATFTCTRGCEETETATITSTTTATCTANGDTTYTATVTFNEQTYEDEKEVATEATGHKGGTATCQEKAVCEVCGASYGELGDHSYSETYATDGNDHWKVCTVCQTAGTKETHTWDTEGYCSVCNMTNNKFFSFTAVTGGYSIEFISTLKNDRDLFNELCELEQIVLPQEHNGQPIVEIAEDGFNCYYGGLNKFNELQALPDGKLVSITIPDTVTTIRTDAFSGFTTLKTVEISENSQLTAIEGSAFSVCIDLTSFYIPKDLDTMNDGVFNNCYALSTITVHPENQTYYAEGNCLINKTTMVLEVGTGNSEIPEGVTKIRDQAFMGRKNLKSITIPASVTTIGANTFYGCENLSSVTFAENSQLATIGGATFSSCYALKSITIPANVTKIGDSAFSSCSTLTSVTFEDTTGWIVNGREKDVSNPSSNAKYFTNYSTYYYSWTKQTD